MSENTETKGFFRRRERASSVEKAVEKLGDGVVSDDGGPISDGPINSPASGIGAYTAQTAVAPKPEEPAKLSRQVTIDHDALRAAGMVCAHSERSLIAE